MKTIKPRAKSKKNNARFGRVKFSNKESVDNGVGPDLSQLRKPIDISVSSLLEVTKLLEIGGEEVKTMLSYECDVVYECRVCRSLFRSLANFISHKRVYCREKFNVALCRKIQNDHIMPAETFIPERELAADNNGKEDDNNFRILRSQVVRQTLKKDLTSVVDMLQKKRSEDINENLLDEASFSLRKSNPKTDFRIENDRANQQILLEAIDSTKTAVYQTATTPTLATVHTADLMKAQIIELQQMADRNTAVLNPEGRSMDASQLEKSDSPMQIYGSDDDEGVGTNCDRDLVCSVCNAKFATRKTLTYHMKSLHVSYRTCYPCPCCDSTFANTWSVYRHLFKLHRKTNEQVRKLRTQIQEKAFRKETTGAEDIEKENSMIKLSSAAELQTTNNTQEWMEHFELDLELQRCGGCGRRFDRRAALMSHSQLCQKRIAACNEASAAGGSKSKRSGKTPSPNNVVEDNNSLGKEPKVVLNRAQTSKKKIPKKNALQLVGGRIEAVSNAPGKVTQERTTNSELSIRVENVSRISNADWEMIGNNLSRSSSNETSSPVSDISNGREQTSPGDEDPLLMNVPDSPEIIFTSIDKARTVAISFGPKKRRVSLINNSRELANGSGENSNSLETSPTSEKDTISPSHMAVMENRIATIANLRKLQCLPCRRKFTSMTNLRRHMAVHIGWHRYRCRLCDFKCFVKCDCVAHCNKVHDAKNNRAVIADMVVHIPPDQSVLGQEILMDLSKSYPASSEPELIDVSESSPKSNDPADLKAAESARENTSETEVEAADKPADNEEPDRADEPESEEEAEGAKKPVSDETANLKKPIPEEIASQTQGRLDNDPDLRKMVMEVIFGTAAGGSETPDSEAKADAVESPSKMQEGKESGSMNDSPKGKGCLTAASKLDEMKRQRPTRNRVKPVQEDFIYDLTELIRKESAIHRAAAITAQKTIKKKHSNQQQTTAADIEGSGEPSGETDANEIQKLSPGCKLSGILSQKKGETNGFSSKSSSLRQTEVKINSSNGISSGKNGGSTKLSVSSQK